MARHNKATQQVTMIEAIINSMSIVGGHWLYKMLCLSKKFTYFIDNRQWII